MSTSSYSQKIVLGRTGLQVSRMGIGCSYGVDTRAMEEAFERGINYFYFGTLRRAAMARAVHHLAPRYREQLVVAIQSYARSASLVRLSVEIALRKLKLDHADLLILGKTDSTPSNRFVDEVLRLKEAGKIRFLAISAHHRPVFEQHIRSGVFDAIMVRYNAAHARAEEQVFPLLPSENRPGVICFTATRWGTLLRKIPGERTLSASDCYRFVLSHAAVDLCLSGPKNRDELQEALRVLDSPPLTVDELAWMRRIGALVYPTKAHNLLLRKLIFD